MQTHPPVTPAHPRLRCMLLAAALLGTQVPHAAAQTPAHPAQNLPLRNLQIEVRQLQSDAREQASAGAQGGVHIFGNGQVGVHGQLQIQQRSQTQSGASTQLALVLNGRSTRMALGVSVPLRVYQSYVRNGQHVTAEGPVLLEARTGFSATPRWSGAETVELEVAAQQSLATAPQAGGLNPNASVGSVLVLPLNTWTTLARSEQTDNNQDRSLLGAGNSTRQSAVEVQVRVTVR